jgi:hypothetical protein
VIMQDRRSTEFDHSSQQRHPAAPASWAPADAMSLGRMLPAPTRRADTRNANQCATASPMVTPQMIPMAWAWAPVSGSAAKAASRQMAT